jgi:Tetratricopeptide repeat
LDSETDPGFFRFGLRSPFEFRNRSVPRSRPQAIEAFERIGEARPGDPEVPKMLARMHHRAGEAPKAIAVLERHMAMHPEQTDLTHVNILAELFMERGGFLKALDLIRRVAQTLCAASGLPVDLQVEPTADEAPRVARVLRTQMPNH